MLLSFGEHATLEVLRQALRSEAEPPTYADSALSSRDGFSVVSEIELDRLHSELVRAQEVDHSLGLGLVLSLRLDLFEDVLGVHANEILQETSQLFM